LVVFFSDTMEPHQWHTLSDLSATFFAYLQFLNASNGFRPPLSIGH